MYAKETIEKHHMQTCMSYHTYHVRTFMNAPADKCYKMALFLTISVKAIRTHCLETGCQPSIHGKTDRKGAREGMGEAREAGKLSRSSVTEANKKQMGGGKERRARISRTRGANEEDGQYEND